MSNYDFIDPDQYSPESFGLSEESASQKQGTPSGNQGAKRGGNRRLITILGLIFGGLGLVVVCCCICLIGSVLYVRQPSGIANLWGTYAQFGNYNFSEIAVCDNSQATTFTRQAESDGLEFESFLVTGDDDTIVYADAVVIQDGERTDRELTFYTAEGGTYGRCIERIEMQILGNAEPSEEETSTPEPIAPNGDA